MSSDTQVIIRPEATTMRHPAAAASFREVQSMAGAMVKSGLFGVKTEDQAVGLMLLCQAEGLHPVDAMRRYHIIQGRASMRSDAMLAEFQARGGRVAWGERTATRVVATFSHPAGGTVEVEWTIEMARAAGLAGKDTWKSFPRQMLTARVISEGIRTVLPGVVVGVYTPEEVEDFEPSDPPPRSQRREAAVEPQREAPPKAKAVMAEALRTHGRTGGWLDDAGKPDAEKLAALRAFVGWPEEGEPSEATVARSVEIVRLGHAELLMRMEAEAAQAAQPSPAKDAGPAPDADAAFDWNG